jgi:hypothetical protein
LPAEPAEGGQCGFGGQCDQALRWPLAIRYGPPGPLWGRMARGQRWAPRPMPNPPSAGLYRCPSAEGGR